MIFMGFVLHHTINYPLVMAKRSLFLSRDEALYSVFIVIQIVGPHFKIIKGPIRATIMAPHPNKKGKEMLVL